MTSAKQQRIILVTGANKGLGFEVVKRLLKESSSSNSDLILIGSRGLERGQDAIIQLGSPANVHLLQLDVSSSDSITHAIDEIKQKYGGKLDIVINNAGILKPELSVDAVRSLLATNYYGNRMLIDQLSPMIKKNGRIVNVASEAGAWALHEMSSDLQQRYKSSTLTLEKLDSLVEEFVSAIESQRLEELGYNIRLPLLAYSISKAALICLTRIVAREWCWEKDVLVLSVCPGLCATDMTQKKAGARSAKRGASSIFYMVNAPAEDLENGEFYQDGQKKPDSSAPTVDLSDLACALSNT